MSRERALALYCLAVGALGWAWLLASGPGGLSPITLLLFLALALLVESAGFRVPPSDPHSLVGIVLLTAALALGRANGALVGAISGLVFGVLLPLLYGRPRSFYLMAARPALRSGVRAIAILLGGALGDALARGEVARLAVALTCYALVIQLNRVAREYLQGGRTGVATWWRSSWRAALSAEVAPLPVAVLGAAIYQRLGALHFAVASAALLASSLTLRHAALNLQRQRRSVRELALLNEVSRAIIRAELDSEALCELIYREASKLVDTASFHLGLFEPGDNRYTLVVRVQDRVRLPPLTVELPAGDGIVGWMRETGRALLVEDFASEMGRLPARPRYQSERPPRAGIYVPLIAGETVIGSISIQSYRARAFDTNDMRMLSLIADQAAVALSKARAFAEARQRAVQLQAIHEVSERITAILDLDALLPSVVRLIHEHFGYHPVHIFTREEDGALAFRASTSEGEALARMRELELRAGEGIVGDAAARSQAVLVNDVRHDPRYISDDAHTRAEMAVPLRFGEQSIGVLDVQSAEADRFHESDLFVMQTLAGQIATAIESARAFSAQREEAWTLNALLQVAENIARATSLGDLLPTIVRLPPLLLGCDRCYCLTWDRARGLFTPLAAYGLRPEQRAAFVGQPFAEDAAPLLSESCQTMAPVAVGDASARPYVCPPILGPFGGGAVLALPLTARGAALGVLVVDYNPPEGRPPEHPFTAREMTLYTGIANQVAGALESALLAQEAAEAERLEQELRVARDIQTALLPARAPSIPGWDIAADWRSARLVGGDFYDFWWLPTADDGRPTTDDRPRATDHGPRTTDHGRPTTDDRPRRPGDTETGSATTAATPPTAAGLRDFRDLPDPRGASGGGRPTSDDRPAAADGGPGAAEEHLSAAGQVAVSDRPSSALGFVIADVSDKGVPAAMFMTLARSHVRAAALDGSAPAQALVRANRWIARDSESAMFVTLFYGVLQPASGLLRYTCAGHNPPLLLRAADGAVVELSTPGIALGVLDEIGLGETSLALAEGDLLVCYTDGVTEAINGSEEAFGVPRLVEVIKAHQHDSAAAVVDAINGALLRFTERPPFDDVTMVVIKRVAA